MSIISACKPSRIAAFCLAATGLLLLWVARANAQETPSTAPAALPGPADGEAEVVRALNAPAELEYIKTPLNDVAHHIGDEYRITVQLDRKALHDAGVQTTTPITCSLRGVPLKTALEVALRPLGLTYIVDDEVLLITTAEAAEVRVHARTYPVRDLISELEGASGANVDAGSLMETMKSCVAPTSWDDAGGNGSMQVHKGVLVVNQTWHVHQLIAEFLANLREARRNKDAHAVIGNSPAQQKLLKALRRPVQLRFKEIPLNNALDGLAMRHGFSIPLDLKALRDEGIDPATPVSLDSPDISLGSALSLLLHDAQLDWVPWDGVLLITTPEVAESMLQTRVYPAADLAVRQDEFGEISQDFESLTELLKTTCATMSWDDAGGAGSLDMHCGALIVSQTFKVHQLLEQTMAALRQAREAQAKPAKAPVSILAGDQATAQRLAAALRKRVTLNASEAPLNDILANLSQQVGAPIALDRPALADAGVFPDRPCTIREEAAPLQGVLKRVLGELGLTFDFRYETLWITSKKDYDQSLTTRVFPVRDLITYADDDGLYLNAEPLEELISSIVAPTTWNDAGGPGSLDTVVGDCDALVCAQTLHVQQALEATLTSLRKTIASQTTPTPEKLDPNPVLKVYSLTGGLPGGGAHFTAREGRPSEEQLAQLIRDLIEPESWDKQQGASVGVVKGALTVRNMPRVQAQVANLLKKLHEWSTEDQSNDSPWPYVNNPDMGAWGMNDFPVSRIRVRPPDYDESVQLEAYHLAPAVIVTEGAKSKTLTPSPEKIAELVQESVAPKTWRSAGGQGFIRVLPGVIVVRQPGAVQRQVAKLLFELKAWDPRGVRIDDVGQASGPGMVQ